MLRPPGKAEKIAKQIMKNKGVKVPPAKSKEKVNIPIPTMQR